MLSSKKLLSLTIILLVCSVLVGFLNIFFDLKHEEENTSYQSLSNDLFTKPKGNVSLIKIMGAIHSGKSTYNSTGSDTILEKLKTAEKDDKIKAILLEINSPGGTVGASQEIYKEIIRLKNKKKVIVSMKDTAASGGYYIASAADFIFALEGTITGSIGVISIMPNIKDLLDKNGIKVNVFRAGTYKGIPSFFSDSNAGADSIFQALILDTHKQFIEDISSGRNKDIKEITKLADGRVYSGKQAFKNKLIDGLGGRRESLKKIEELTGIKKAIISSEFNNPFDRFIQLIEMSRVSFFGDSSLTKIINSPILLILPSFYINL